MTRKKVTSQNIPALPLDRHGNYELLVFRERVRQFLVFSNQYQLPLISIQLMIRVFFLPFVGV